MNEQNPSDDPVKSPEIQEIIMSYRIGIIAARTCADLHDKRTGLYLYGNLYIADEFMRECESAF